MVLKIRALRADPNLNSLKIIDASWHMPAQKRNPAEEYLNAHIPNSVFFDLDENSEKDTDLSRNQNLKSV